MFAFAAAAGPASVETILRIPFVLPRITRAASALQSMNGSPGCPSIKDILDNVPAGARNSGQDGP